MKQYETTRVAIQHCFEVPFGLFPVCRMDELREWPGIPAESIAIGLAITLRADHLQHRDG
jgi:hypothetical protein